MQEVIAWSSPGEAWMYHHIVPYMFDICRWIAIISGAMMVALSIYVWIQQSRRKK